jgi:hypothetical protein
MAGTSGNTRKYRQRERTKNPLGEQQTAVETCIIFHGNFVDLLSLIMS